jgi:hypothetical protein
MVLYICSPNYLGAEVKKTIPSMIQEKLKRTYLKRKIKTKALRTDLRQ